MTRRKFDNVQWREIKRLFIVKGKKKIKDVKAYRRLQALYLRGIGKTNVEISEITGFSAQYIVDLVAKYLKNGIDSILQDKRTSNNRRMTFEQESNFLEQFVELAEAGQIVTVSKILDKFNEETGKNNDSSTIYRLLERHGWRKVKPRPRHPGKASEAEIEASKKLTKNSGNSYWKKIGETSVTRVNSTNA